MTLLNLAHVVTGLIVLQNLSFLSIGMDEVSLTTFLRTNPSLIKVVFPREAERVILADEVKELINFEDRSENEQNGRTAEFYESYIDELEVGIKGWISKQ